eukprot:356684-Chlamydomonas_euryale.AAC.5
MQERRMITVRPEWSPSPSATGAAAVVGGKYCDAAYTSITLAQGLFSVGSVTVGAEGTLKKD